MSDSTDTDTAAAPPRPSTAGGLLRQARQAQGLHIAALAAAIKVVPRKLELLESDQFDQLPDATFTRALAHTVCRTLKIDPAPVLALLPPPLGHRLENVGDGLNTPFRERPGRAVPRPWAGAASPTLWIVVVLALATAGLYLMPAGWLTFSRSESPRASVEVPAPAPAVDTKLANEPAPAASAASPPLEEASGVNAATTAPTADAVTPGGPSGILQLHTSAQSWIEVTDAHGQTLIARTVEAGENLDLDGTAPLKVRIGNAGGTQVEFRGRPVVLTSFTRDNVARLELK